MGWIVLLPALALLLVINRKVRKSRKGPSGRGQDVVAVLTMVLATAVGCGVAFTFLGQWEAAVVSWLGSLLASVTGSGVGWVVPVALVLALIAIATWDIAVDREADKGAQWAAVLVPTLVALAIGGSMGKTGGDAVRQADIQVAAVITQIGHR